MSVFNRLACQLYLPIFAALLPVSAAAAAVDSRGGYSTSVPIVVPELRSITPSITLTYDSNAGNGPLGAGWSLNAASRIVRTSALKGTPRFDQTDLLWLDGMELLPCPVASSVSCTTGGTHATRIEGFKRIRQDPTSNTFTVWRGDGTRLTYSPQLGDVSVPVRTLRWVLTRVEDTHGNRAAYTYICDVVRECYLSTITYGEGALCECEPDAPRGTPLPGARIQFYWEDRPDPVTFASGGFFIEQRWRLKTIDVSDVGERARAYQLTYLVDRVSGASALISVQNFGSDAILSPTGAVISGTALPAQTFEAPAHTMGPAPNFDYEVAGMTSFVPLGPAQGALPSVYANRTVPVLSPGVAGETAVADVDGDARVDVVQWSLDTNCGLLTTRTVLASGLPGASVTNTQAWTGPPAAECASLPPGLPPLIQGYTAELDGDRQTDLLFVTHVVIAALSGNGIGVFEIHLVPALSNGDGTFRLAPAFRTWITNRIVTGAAGVFQSQCRVGDVNGDTRDDFVCSFYDPQPLTAVWKIGGSISLGGGRFLNQIDSAPNGISENHSLATGDVNGDGLTDLIAVDQSGASGQWPVIDVKIGVSNGSGFYQWRQQPTTEPGKTAFQSSRVLVGDFNGDGRADFSYFINNDNGSGSAFVTFTSDGGASRTYDVHRQFVKSSIPIVSVGDVDGDRLDDILVAVGHGAHDATVCGIAVNHTHPSLTAALSLGDGTFRLPEQFTACYRETDWQWLSGWRFFDNPRRVDVNGDHRADFLQFWPDGSGSLTIADLPGQVPAARDAWRWRPTDVNGDGRTDWVYTSFGNPGLIVLTLITQPDGTRLRVRADILPSPGSLDLTSVDAVGDWFLVDVGRPGQDRSPDGRADLVLVDDARRIVVTLLSNGNGMWEKVVHPLGLPLKRDVHNWRPMDVDGDGRTDLVHLSLIGVPALAPGSLQVETLRARGDGRWDELRFTHFAGTFTDPNVSAFVPADVNGDGLMDLVSLEFQWIPPVPANTVIRTLLAKGDGSWQESAQPLNQPYQDTGRWRAMEINGDGRTDLIYVGSDPNLTRLRLVSMLSLGNGSFQSPQTVELTPPQNVDLESIHDVRIADVDGDGRQDLVKVTNVRGTSVVLATSVTVVWNQFPAFVVATNPALPYGYVDTNAWRLVDVEVNADDRPELVRVGDLLDMKVIVLPVPESRLTSVRNGTGASEDVTYATSVGRHRDMPLGRLAHVVTWVGHRAADDGGPYASIIEYGYTNAVYSRARREFLGFARIESNDRVRIVGTDFDLSDDCGARQAAVEIREPDQKLLERTRTSFVAESGPLPGPRSIRCIIETITRDEFEGSNTPRTSVTLFQRDFFGNLVLTQQSGDLNDVTDDRAVAATFNPNRRDFVVDRIASLDVRGRDAAGWTLLSSTQFEYDGSGDYSQPPGPLGELTRRRRWNNVTASHADVSYSYTSRGHLRAVTGPATSSNPNGVTTTIDYDCEYKRFPELRCDSLFCEASTWDKRLGVVTSVLDVNQGTTSFAYDPLGRLTRVTYPDRGFERWQWPADAEWDTPAQAIRHEVSDGSPGDGVLWRRVHFDGYGRTTTIAYEGGRSEETPRYDGISSRIVQKSAIHFGQLQPHMTTFGYDAAGRLRFVSHPDNSSRRVGYSVGIATEADELGATTVRSFDPFGRITGVRENLRKCVGEGCPIGESALTTYVYDALDRLVNIRDTYGNVTELGWDSLGRQQRACDPDRGCVRYEWNDDDTLLSETDANGRSSTMVYDMAGRPIQRESYDPGRGVDRTIRWTWDRDPMTGAPRGASLGRIAHVDDSSSIWNATTYHYDSRGRGDLTTWCVDKRCVEAATEFDSAGRTTQIVYPDATGRLSTAPADRVEYRYDESGFLVSVPGYLSKIIHDAAGRIASIEYVNGVRETRSRDPRRGWIDSLTLDVPGGWGLARVLQQSLVHDPVGRLSGETIGTALFKRTETYAHDDLGRLTSVTSSDPSRTRRFEYDLIGNLTHASQIGALFYADPAHVHAATGTVRGGRYQYDAVGQLIASDRLDLSWGSDHKPVEVTERASGSSSRYAYDWVGRRVRAETAAGVTLTPNPLVEVDSGGNVITWIVAEGRRFARRDPKNTVFLHADALGSTRVVTDPKGTMVDQDDFGTWGEERRLSLWQRSGNQYRFAGSASDDTGLNQMNARYYDPALMHFISADTLVPNVYSPQTLNRYAYALNDPVTLIDPTGHQASDPDEWVPWPYEPVIRTDIIEIVGEPPLSPPPLVPADGPSPVNWTPGLSSSTDPQYASQLTPASFANGSAGKPVWQQPFGFQSGGLQAGGGGAVCLILCLGVVDVQFGIYEPNDPSEGFSPFVSFGWAALLMTEAPPATMSMADESGNQIPHNGLMISPGVAFALGGGVQGFVSETRNFSDFEGYSLNMNGSVGPVGAGVSLNPSGTTTYSVGAGFGPRQSWLAGATMFGSRTFGFTIRP